MGKRTISSVKVTDVEKRRLPSKHYVYVINVTWSDGSTHTVYRRYSRFFDFQNELLDKFPEQAGEDNPSQRIIPFLPGKKFFGRSHIREVAEKRLKPIDEYCQTLIKLPDEISASEEVLSFFETEPEDIEPIKERHVSKKPKGNQISGPKLLEQYVAVADYEPQGKGEIRLQQGMAIEVAEKMETGWWFVTAEDQQGWVPSTYLQRQDGGEEFSTETAAPGQEKEYVCTTAFTADGPDEIDMDIGSIVLVIEKNLQGWWKVRLSNQEGYVPAAYLSKVDTDKLAGAQRGNRSSPPDDNRLSQGVQVVSSLSEVSEYFKPSSNTSSPRKQPPPRTNSLPRNTEPIPAAPDPVRRVKEYHTIDSFQDSMGDGISFSAGQLVKVLEKNPSGWWYVEIEGQEGWAPAAYIDEIHETNTDDSYAPQSGDDGVPVNGSAILEEEEENNDDENDSFDDDTPNAQEMSAFAGALQAKLGGGHGPGAKGSAGPPPPPSKPVGIKPVVPTPPHKPAGIKPTLPPTPPSKPSDLKGPATPLKPGGLKLPTTPGQAPSTPIKPPAKPVKPSVPPIKPQTPGKSSSSSDSSDRPSVRPKTNMANDLANVLQARFNQTGGSSSGEARFNQTGGSSSGLTVSKPTPPPPPSKAKKPVLAQKQPRYRASAAFTAENSGELTLSRGDDVTVVQADEGGWWLVKVRGEEGWAPASYIEEVSDDTDSVSTRPSLLTPVQSHVAENTGSNSLMDEISSKFGARLKPVAKPGSGAGPRSNGNVTSPPLVPNINRAKSKGRLPPVPPQKPV